MNTYYKKSLNDLNKKIEKCSQCERLVDFRTTIAKNKRKMYQNEQYWGKPIKGFGDVGAELMILGLAPAAHGGNRTGRVFTGDKSSDFLFKCLYEVGLSNQSHSNYKNDGLKLINNYLTLAVKCVPPEDKPSKDELYNCFSYLKEEIRELRNIKIILCLGKVAFDSILKFYNINYNIKLKNYKFSHGAEYILPDNKKLLGSYHPSPRNVNTKKIDKYKFIKLLANITHKLKNENQL